MEISLNVERNPRMDAEKLRWGRAGVNEPEDLAMEGQDTVMFSAGIYLPTYLPNFRSPSDFPSQVPQGENIINNKSQ